MNEIAKKKLATFGAKSNELFFCSQICGFNFLYEKVTIRNLFVKKRDTVYRYFFCTELELWENSTRIIWRLQLYITITFLCFITCIGKKNYCKISLFFCRKILSSFIRYRFSFSFTCKRERGDGRLVMGDETRDDTTVQGLAIYQTKLKMVFCWQLY